MNEFNHFLEGKITAPPIVLIVTGAIIFFIASLGCYGAIRESPTLLMLVKRKMSYKLNWFQTKTVIIPQFASLLGIIFIIELAVGIAACVFKADLEMVLKDSLGKSIVRSDTADIMAWDNVQQKLMCCGVNGPSDWVDYSRNKTLRASCCQAASTDFSTNDCKNSPALFQHKYYQVG